MKNGDKSNARSANISNNKLPECKKEKGDNKRKRRKKESFKEEVDLFRCNSLNNLNKLSTHEKFDYFPELLDIPLFDPTKTAEKPKKSSGYRADLITKKILHTQIPSRNFECENKMADFDGNFLLENYNRVCTDVGTGRNKKYENNLSCVNEGNSAFKRRNRDGGENDIVNHSIEKVEEKDNINKDRLKDNLKDEEFETVRYGQEGKKEKNEGEEKKDNNIKETNDEKNKGDDVNSSNHLSDDEELDEVESEFGGFEDKTKTFNDTRSVISNYIFHAPRMMERTNNESSYAPSVLNQSEFRDTASNFLMTELAVSKQFRLVPGGQGDETEVEISNEGAFMETPKRSGGFDWRCVGERNGENKAANIPNNIANAGSSIIHNNNSNIKSNAIPMQNTENLPYSLRQDNFLNNYNSNNISSQFQAKDSSSNKEDIGFSVSSNEKLKLNFGNNPWSLQMQRMIDKINEREVRIKERFKNIKNLTVVIKRFESENRKYENWIKSEEKENEVLVQMINFLMKQKRK